MTIELTDLNFLKTQIQFFYLSSDKYQYNFNHFPQQLATTTLSNVSLNNTFQRARQKTGFRTGGKVLVDLCQSRPQKSLSTMNLKVITSELPQETTTSSQPSGNDIFDQYNKPRFRRTLILSSLSTEYSQLVSFLKPHPPSNNNEGSVDLLDLYRRVHDVGMIQFLLEAWSKWDDMGEQGRYKECCHPQWNRDGDDCIKGIPPMVPCHVAFRRDGIERPSQNVMGAMGYYCTDMMTPIVGTLVEELKRDAEVVCMAVECALQEDRVNSVSYAVTIHPGHHANRDNFGGYCYLNNAALCARLMQERLETADINDINDDNEHNKEEPPKKKRKCRIAILDIDYHCGNGTASIFYQDPNIFFVSIHCDPSVEYPFNSGYEDQTGSGEGEGTTMHIPLAPGATWEGSYKAAVEKAMNAIVDFDVAGLVISMGLDTYEGDSVAVNRGGFQLSGKDYYEMGLCMGRFMAGRNISTIFIQEGGYKMDVVGKAAADVVGGFATGAGGIDGAIRKEDSCE